VNGTPGAQRDHPALRASLVAIPLARDDQDRLVPGGQVARAEFGQRGAQPARARRDEVGQPDDPHNVTLAGFLAPLPPLDLSTAA
jgi:hypothetical protein